MEAAQQQRVQPRIRQLELSLGLDVCGMDAAALQRQLLPAIRAFGAVRGRGLPNKLGPSGVHSMH